MGCTDSKSLDVKGGNTIDQKNDKRQAKADEKNPSQEKNQNKDINYDLIDAEDESKFSEDELKSWF